MSLPKMIQAITISKTGGPEVIEKTEVPFPQHNPSHLVIKVEYLGINFIDTYFRQGTYSFKSLPAPLGQEAAGVIVGLPTDESVLTDADYKKQGYQIGGKVAIECQGHAEYVSVPWIFAYPLPDSLSTRIGAASFIQAMTAVSFMIEAYAVQKGDVILVHTVAGGLGLIMSQYANHLGATVIGTTSTKEKAELAKANGACHVILYPVEDTVQRVLEITGGEGVHAVFDGVGKDTFDNNFRLTRRKGTIVSVGNASGVVPPFPPLKLVEKNLKICRPKLGNYAYTAEERQYYGEKVFSLIAEGAISIRIFKEYAFTAAGLQEAHRDLVGGKSTGKLIVKVIN